MSMSRTRRAAQSALVLASVGAAGAAQADVIAINFLGTGYAATGQSVTADAFGVAVGDWTNQDVANAAGSTTVSGVDFDWATANDWNQNNGNAVAGDNEVYFGYIDDTINAGTAPSGGVVSISGLAAWLAGSGDATYTVRVVQGSDNATGFTDTELFDSDGGSLLDTLVNPAAGGGGDLGGITGASVELSGDTLFVNPVDRAGSVRATIAGIIIETTPVPEPASAALLGLGSLLVLRRRR